LGILDFLLTLLHLRAQTITLSAELLLGRWQHLVFFFFHVVLHALHHFLEHTIGHYQLISLSVISIHHIVVFDSMNYYTLTPRRSIPCF
jgi:hypothetical protein